MNTKLAWRRDIFQVAACLACVVFFTVSGFAQKYPCLPSDVKTDSVVRTVTNSSPRGDTFARITVGQTLKKLKAECYRGKLVDSKRRPIRFFYLQGCWGNPPENYQQILDSQTKEIANLKRRYTVIEMTCNSDGTPPRLIS
ncbi:MAG: hypothetical protein ABJB40_12185 [Acidobacteriota bacterium]